MKDEEKKLYIKWRIAHNSSRTIDGDQIKPIINLCRNNNMSMDTFVVCNVCKKYGASWKYMENIPVIELNVFLIKHRYCGLENIMFLDEEYLPDEYEREEYEDEQDKEEWKQIADRLRSELTKE